MNEEELEDEFRNRLNRKNIDKRAIKRLMTEDIDEDMNSGEDMSEWPEMEDFED